MGFLESSKLCLPNNTLRPWTYALTVCWLRLAPAVKALNLLCLRACTHTLRLGMPPQILQFPDDLKIRAGEQVSLLCKFTGAPPMNSTWLKFRKPVSVLLINKQCFNKTLTRPAFIVQVTANKFKTDFLSWQIEDRTGDISIESTDSSSQLTIAHSQQEHCGCYTIEIRNSYGMKQAALNLTIVGKASSKCTNANAPRLHWHVHLSVLSTLILAF